MRTQDETTNRGSGTPSTNTLVRGFAIVGFGVVLLAAPVQAAPCGSNCGDRGESSTKHDRDLSSIRLDRTQGPTFTFHVSNARLPDLLSERDFRPKGRVDTDLPSPRDEQDQLVPDVGDWGLEPPTRGLPEGPGPSVPEPRAFLLFGAGLLTVHTIGLRRRI